MNAIKLLKQQHREVKALFSLASKTDQSARLQKVAFEIADKLAVHAAIEEKLFYPASMRERTQDQLREAVEEHLGVKRIIADLLRDSPDDPQYPAKLRVLSEMVMHHVEEEEESLFPSVEKLMDKDALKDLGAQMEQAAEALVAEGDPRDQVPQETSAPAELPGPAADAPARRRAPPPRRAKRS